MRPIAHARRLSSRAASSRRAVDAVVVGNPVPLGIPALFLADQLSRGRSLEQILSGKRGLIAEYAGAEGYAYAWGHLIEQRLGRFVLWRRSSRCISQPRATAPTWVFRHDELAPDGRQPTVQLQASA